MKHRVYPDLLSLSYLSKKCLSSRKNLKQVDLVLRLVLLGVGTSLTPAAALAASTSGFASRVRVVRPRMRLRTLGPGGGAILGTLAFARRLGSVELLLWPASVLTRRLGPRSC